MLIRFVVAATGRLIYPQPDAAIAALGCTASSAEGSGDRMEPVPVAFYLSISNIFSINCHFSLLLASALQPWNWLR